MSGMHARPGRRRDTWTRAAGRLRSALAWYFCAGEWRWLATEVRALNAAFAGALRSPAPDCKPVQGSRPGDPPLEGGEVRAGAGPDAPVDYWPAYLPAPISRRAGRAAGGATGPAPVAGAPEVPAPPDAPRPGAGTSPQLRPAAPEAAGPPLVRAGAVPRPPWDDWPRPAAPAPRQAWRGSAERRRDTLAMAVLRDPVPSYYLAHLARCDTAVMSA